MGTPVGSLSGLLVAAAVPGESVLSSWKRGEGRLGGSLGHAERSGVPGGPLPCPVLPRSPALGGGAALGPILSPQADGGYCAGMCSRLVGRTHSVPCPPPLSSLPWSASQVSQVCHLLRLTEPA